jgi:hypothetical protein
MPTNPYQIDELIDTAVNDVAPFFSEKDLEIQEARSAFQFGNFDQQRLIDVTWHLTDKVDRLLRCGCPTGEPMTSQYPPTPISQPLTLLAVDGSQVVPNRRRRVWWSLTNVASAAMQVYPGNESAPEIRVNTELYLENKRITTEHVVLSEESIGMLRDVREREWLGLCVAEASKNGLCCGMLDGGVELWADRPGQGSSGGFKKSLSSCIDVFNRMKESNLPYIGYVQSGDSELLVRLLEIAITDEKDLPSLRKNRKFEHVQDIDLMENWLKPDYRSAIFELRTRAMGAFKGDLRTFFFFLNVGEADAPSIVRIELPAWLLTRQDLIGQNLIGQIQSAILMQSRIVPGVYSPYVMIRADEEARISRNDQDEIQARIEAAYIAKGLRIKPESPKDLGKELTS